MVLDAFCEGPGLKVKLRQDRRNKTGQKENKEIEVLKSIV